MWTLSFSSPSPVSTTAFDFSSKTILNQNKTPDSDIDKESEEAKSFKVSKNSSKEVTEVLKQKQMRLMQHGTAKVDRLLSKTNTLAFAALNSTSANRKAPRFKDTNADIRSMMNWETIPETPAKSPTLSGYRHTANLKKDSGFFSPTEPR